MPKRINPRLVLVHMSIRKIYPLHGGWQKLCRVSQIIQEMLWSLLADVPFSWNDRHQHWDGLILWLHFGGVKESGFGVKGGSHGIEEFQISKVWQCAANSSGMSLLLTLNVTDYHAGRSRPALHSSVRLTLGLKQARDVTRLSCCWQLYSVISREK